MSCSCYCRRSSNAIMGTVARLRSRTIVSGADGLQMHIHGFMQVVHGNGLDRSWFILVIAMKVEYYCHGGICCRWQTDE